MTLEPEKLYQENLKKRDIQSQKEQDELRAQAIAGDEEAKALVAWEEMVKAQEKIKLNEPAQPSEELVWMREFNKPEHLNKMTADEQKKYQADLATLEEEHIKEVGRRVGEDFHKVKKYAEAQRADNKQNEIQTRDKDKNHLTLDDLKHIHGDKIGETAFNEIAAKRGFIENMRRKFLGIENRLSKSETQAVFIAINRQKNQSKGQQH